MKFVQKIQFLKLFGAFLRCEESEFGQKRCKIECSDVSGTTWKKSLFKHWENDNFPHLALFVDPLQNYLFEMYENRAIITQVLF